MIEISPKDLSISTFNTGGSWFPNTSGVRVMHKPTKISAECGDERSQHRNKAVAYARLTVKLQKYLLKVALEQTKPIITFKTKKPHVTRYNFRGNVVWAAFVAVDAPRPFAMANDLSVLLTRLEAHSASSLKAERVRESCTPKGRVR